MKLRTVISACTLIAAIPFTSQAELNSAGNWDIKRGDTLYNIARRVAPGNGKEQARLRKHMFDKSPSAFKNNNPGALEVGSTLSLPGAATVSKPTPKPKPALKAAAVVAPAVISAPKLSAPSVPAPKISAPAASSSDSFKARIEAKRIAKEAADKRRAVAEQLAAEKAAQAGATAALEAQKQADANAAAAAMQQKADAAAKAAQKKAAADAAARAAKQKAAAAAKAVKTRAPAQVNNSINKSNPYIECKTTNPDEKCGTWNITFKGR